MTTDRRAAHPEGAIGRADAPGMPAGCEELAGIAARFGGALERFFRKRVFDESEAEDLVQEVFCRLAARAGSHRIQNPEAYVFQVAANLLRDRARTDLSQREAKQRLVLGRRDDRDEISPERVVLGRERIDLVRHALNELPERTRAIFVLHRFEGLKYREIARRLGISASLVEKHIMDAIGHLRLRLGLE
ncbi:MAG TPA: sigma-70 family RNA polymerase sigma factor [Woeseiaceae bacterium]|nr:sigma-70 family RNA polymerase sigma factor [Woeseiaceae bacterium]